MLKKRACLLFLTLFCSFGLQSPAQEAIDVMDKVPPALEELQQSFHYSKSYSPQELQVFLRHEHPKVRYEAFLRLDIHHPESPALLESALSDTHVQVRGVVIAQLIKKLGVNSLPILLPRLESESFYNQIAIVQVVKQFPLPDTIPVILKAWMNQLGTDWEEKEDVFDEDLYMFSQNYLAAFEQLPQADLMVAVKPYLSSQRTDQRMMALNLLLRVKDKLGEQTLKQWLLQATDFPARVDILKSLWLGNLYSDDPLFLETLTEAAIQARLKKLDIRFAGQLAHVIKEVETYESFYRQRRERLVELMLPYALKPETRFHALSFFNSVEEDSPLLVPVIVALEHGHTEEIQWAYVLSQKIQTPQLEQIRLKLLEHPDPDVQIFVFGKLAETKQFLPILREKAKQFLASENSKQRFAALYRLTQIEYPQSEVELIRLCEADGNFGVCDILWRQAAEQGKIEIIERLKPWLFAQDEMTVVNYLGGLIARKTKNQALLFHFFDYHNGLFSFRIGEYWRERGWDWPEQLADRIEPGQPESRGVLYAMTEYPFGIHSEKLTLAIRRLLHEEKEPDILAAAIKIWIFVPTVNKQEKLDVLRTLGLDLNLELKQEIELAKKVLGPF